MDNYCHNNQGRGMSFSNSDKNEIIYNECSSNLHDGLSVDGDDNIISFNTIKSNYRNGIKIHGACNNLNNNS